MEIPNLRNKNERDKWRNDTLCTDPNATGDMLVPSFSKGNPEIPDEVYEQMREKYMKDLKENAKYVKAALEQSSIMDETILTTNDNIMMGKDSL